LKSNSSEPFVISHVTFRNTRLVDHTNQYHPDIDVFKAKKMAEENGLDLVCFNRPERNNLALCKLIDYGKWKYSNEKSKKKQQKSHKKTTKEIRFSPVISDHDVEHKLKQVFEFLDDGDDVLFFMRLKGRQRHHFDYAEERMNQIVSMCEEHGKEVSRKKNPSLITVRISKSTQKEEK